MAAFEVTTEDIEELNIVTLNHDTLVEQFLAENGVDFTDGFGEPTATCVGMMKVYELIGRRLRIA